MSSPNTNWRNDKISEHYGIPYYLCEFNGLEPPRDKWDHPVVWINWFSAAAFCNWRSDKEEREKVYIFNDFKNIEIDTTKNGWRLPYSNEWLKATTSNYSEDIPFNEDIAIYKHCY